MVQAPLPRLLVLHSGSDEHETVLKYLQAEFGWVKTADHPDLHWLNQPDSAVTIEEIRKLQTTLSFKPYQATHSVVVIHHIETASLPAQNALLKTLEEPPAHAQLVLTTTSLDAVVPTVVSRCSIIKLDSGNSLEESHEISAIIKDIPTKSFSELIDLAEQYGDRVQAQAFIRQLTQAYQAELEVAASPQTVKSINVLSQAQTQLDQNLNVRLVVESALFQIKQLTQN